MKLQNFINKNLYKRSIISIILYPISILYAFLQISFRKLYRKKILRSFKSRIKIISIGNIVSGGSGKTPFTIFLAKYLTENGKKVAISHRGYKGDYENLVTLISDFQEVFPYAKHAGDESFLIALKSPRIPVISGRNRKLAIKILEKKFPDLDYIILDDSYQHHRVQRDYDFVIFNHIGGIGNRMVLPSGILREPLSTLKHSDFIVYRGSKTIPNYLKKYNKPILTGSYKISRIYNRTFERFEVSDLSNKRIALLSGIGLPESFENTIKKANLDFVHHFKMPDHYDFKDISLFYQIKSELSIRKIDAILTTEKDFSKLQFLPIIGLPFYIVAIEFSLDNEDFVSELLE
ncbi:MAG: tetraacyldisaccharide 4'-kinase [Candidatus Cloacimonetes bacterium]|nr:tetraacyldisaccharide 4'-kinase [Candidatus Cloacimonadota bacterium]